jgi:undecaprenyl phosphate N,N'-diacetylbacillosamine 1-phosphate transferase
MLYPKVLKRFLDLILAVSAFPFICFIILLASPFIYFSDKGSIFYLANRIGQQGKIFKILKLRTMFINSPDIRLEDGSTFNSEDDPRVTKVGRILRATSIDELPQIINVILGDMSFIGPRPDPEDWLEKYTDFEREFLKVKPGISGYNQAYFRNSADGALKLKNDVYYAKNISFLFDLKILIKTFSTVILRDNLHVDMSQRE